MATTELKLTGKAYWAKVFESNKDSNEDFHGPGGAYTIQLVVEQDMLDAYAATGGRIQSKVTEQGVCLNFKRKHTHHIEPFGGPPQVVDAESQPWSGTIIGNGSTVEVALTVYDTKMGKGTRLEGVRVVESVELPEMEEKAPKLPF